MNETPLTIRTTTIQKMDIALAWAAAEGWNPGLHDADCFHAADPYAFLLGFIGDEPVATISAVKYGQSFGFIGFYIVKPEYRGKGYGIQIWNAAMAQLKGRIVGLDGVFAQQANYMKSGFKLAYRNIRYRGMGGGVGSGDTDIVPLSKMDFDEVGDYDAPFFPDERRAFLRCWIAQPQGCALGIKQNGRLAGYGVLRICRSGYKIGPLFADAPDLAERLFLALKSNAPNGAPVFLDIPEVNPSALDLVKRHAMTAEFETARMYTGAFPHLPLDRLFGVTSFELG